MLTKFNKFDKNLKFTVDTFPEGNIHFLDIKISADSTDVYCKDTHTGQYMHFTTFEPFSHKTAWIKSLFNDQISFLTSCMLWNGYPNSIISINPLNLSLFVTWKSLLFYF